MNRRDFLKKGTVWLGGLTLSGCAGEKARKRRTLKNECYPNIVFILADDMGYGDISAFNPDSRIPTPNLNRLCDEGVRFTDAHSGSAVCSPTRYGILTGRYSWRTDLKNGVLWPPDDKPMIGPDRLTVAGLLKRRGYHTACFGKWHVGVEWGRDESGELDYNRPLRYGPNDVGFDESLIIAGSLDMVPYAFYRNHKPTSELTEEQQGLPFPRFIRQGPRAQDFDPEKVLDRLTEEAVGFVDKRASKPDPFFLYLPLTAPHKPAWPAERFRGGTELGPYADFITQVDWSVGQVLDALDRNQVKENTLVIFTSDNGSYMYRWPEDQPDHLDDAGVQGYHPDSHRANAGWRGTKADIWEAGHRIPFIVRWPEAVKPEGTCEHTICLTDFMATCAEITGEKLPENAGEDSFSLLSLMKGGDWTEPRSPVIHHSSNGTFSIREGRWKMVFGSGSGGREKPVGKPFEKPYFLFDLTKDPAEKTNVIDMFPDVASKLAEKMNGIIQAPGSRNFSPLRPE
jgi:arylsulfatase A